MAYVDFMANHSDTRTHGFGFPGDTIGSPFLLPSFAGAFHRQAPPHPHPPHLPPAPPTTVCLNCFAQCDQSISYNGFCSNCVARMSSTSSATAAATGPPPPPPASEQDVSDSFIMSNMLNVVNDVLREDVFREDVRLDSTQRVMQCSVCGARQSDFMQCMDCHEAICVSCIPCHPQNHNFIAAHLNPISSPRPSSLSPQSSASCISDCSQSENEEESMSEYCEVHANERVRYFCQSCTALLCYSCISNGHQHHSHTTIREAYERIRPSMENVASSTSQKVKHLTASIESSTGMREKIVRKKEEAVEKVQQMFQSYREAIIRHEKDIIAQIAVLTDLRLKSLTKEKEGNQKMLVNLRRLQKNISDAKDSKKKASAVLLYHTLSKQLNNSPETSVPIEDDSFIVKANSAGMRESLKTLCIVTTAPYPPLCSAVGEGLFHPRINRLATVLVTTKDRTGELCLEGGEQLLVTLRANRGSLLKVDVRDNQDGSYTIGFRPKVKGEHQLSVSIRGHHIKGSPFKLNVDGGREYSHFGVTNIFGNEGNKPGQFCRPWGITSDQKGHIIVGDRSNHRIQVFDSNGVLKTVFGSEGTGQGQFNRPAGVATTRDGHIVVADKDNHRIQVLKIDGTFLFKFGSKGGNDGQMIYPYDVAVNQVDGRIAVTDTGNHRLLIFSSEGILLGKFGYKGYLCGHFDSPRGIAFNDEGHIIVSDFNVHHILVIHPDGTTARILGSQGVGNGQFMRPQGIAVDHLGNFVVADTRNSRIVIMHPSGHFIAKFGSPGSGQGQLDRPTSVCVLPDGRIAVVDFGNSRVQVF